MIETLVSLAVFITGMFFAVVLTARSAAAAAPYVKIIAEKEGELLVLRASLGQFNQANAKLKGELEEARAALGSSRSRRHN